MPHFIKTEICFPSSTIQNPLRRRIRKSGVKFAYGDGPGVELVSYANVETVVFDCGVIVPLQVRKITPLLLSLSSVVIFKFFSSVQHFTYKINYDL
jgi:hypothetical protein